MSNYKLIGVGNNAKTMKTKTDEFVVYVSTDEDLYEQALDDLHGGHMTGGELEELAAYLGKMRGK